MRSNRRNKLKSVSEPDVALQILEKIKHHPKFKHFIDNVDPSTLEPNPWVSNFVIISHNEDPTFCDSVTELLNERKTAIFIGIMRSVDDPDKLIQPFHPVHVDSRKSDKTLMVLAGSGNYPVFAKLNPHDLSIFEKLYLYFLNFILLVIEQLKLRPLQGKLSHRLFKGLREKVYEGTLYYNDVNSEMIKFNNMLPHHSHPLPTKYSLLLQVVYN